MSRETCKMAHLRREEITELRLAFSWFSRSRSHSKKLPPYLAAIIIQSYQLLAFKCILQTVLRYVQKSQTPQKQLETRVGKITNMLLPLR